MNRKASTLKQPNAHSLFTVAEVELVYRNKTKPADRPRLTRSNQVYDVLLNAWDSNKIELVEQFYVLLLDRSLSCLGVSLISTGGVTGCLADPKVIFATALKARATALILAHNHPSGNINPSEEDKRLTKKLTHAANLLDMTVPDHMIISPYAYYSFADERLMP